LPTHKKQISEEKRNQLNASWLKRDMSQQSLKNLNIFYLKKKKEEEERCLIQ
jgi:hypothetical protein